MRTTTDIGADVMLRLAVLSSAGSKLTGILLQGLAIPLVYHSLGDRFYAIFLLLGAALTTLALTQLGGGAGLTQAIARSAALQDRKQQAAAFCAGFSLSTVMALSGVAIIFFIAHHSTVARLFGSAFAQDSDLILRTLDIALVIGALQVIMGTVDSVMAGYQEQVATNMGTLTANLISTVLLVIVCRHKPSLITVFLVLYGVTVATRAANLVHLLLRRGYLLNGWSSISRTSFNYLLSTGVAFWIVELSLVLEQQGGTYVMSHLSTPHTTDIFAVCYRLAVLCGSLGIMITQPLWPAFTDAMTRRDYVWVQNTSRKIRHTLLMVGLVAGVGVATAGPSLIRVIWKISLTGNRMVMVMLGFYIFCNLWTNFHYVVLMGMDRTWTVAGVIIAENIVVLLSGVILVPRFGPLGMSLAYILGSLLVPAWLLPLVLRSRMQALSSSSHSTSTVAVANEG